MKRIASLFLSIVFIFVSTFISFAHSGRTDSSGGHKDNKNASGLGSYHYHHGYPPHLHTNGVCPYNNPKPNSNTPSSPPSSSTQTASKPEAEKTKVIVIVEKSAIYEKASTTSEKLATVKEGYTFTAIGSTKTYWKMKFKKKNDNTVYTGYILKKDTDLCKD